MTKIIDACSALINSKGGGDENRALVHLQRGSMYRRLGNSRRPISPNRLARIRSPRWPGPAAATPIAASNCSIRRSPIIPKRLKPDDATCYNNRGNVWQDLKNHARAIADCDAAIKIDPTDATAYFNRGNSRLETGDRDGAVADYRPAAKLNPSQRQATERLQQMKTKL